MKTSKTNIGGAERKCVGEPVAWKWRRTPTSNWVCIGYWDSIEAKAASEMESRGWEVVRLYDSPQSAELDKLRAEVERLRSMTAVTLGVGSGDGNLFVHGDYDSIKAVQALVFRADQVPSDADKNKVGAFARALLVRHAEGKQK